MRKIAFFLLLCVAAAFSSCDNDNSSGYINGLPIGTWVSTYDEKFVITSDTFTSLYLTTTNYSAKVVNFRQIANGEGYITILYDTGTTMDNYDNAGNVIGQTNVGGKYCVIYFKEYTIGTIRISQSSDGLGKNTQTDAESEYTLEKGYFGYDSACSKQ